MNTIRCPNCRGAKQVAKLGGMLGDCNMCAGTGSINEADKPKPVNIEKAESASDIISQVASVAPKAIRIEKEKKVTDSASVAEARIKIDPRKAIFRRKERIVQKQGAKNGNAQHTPADGRATPARD